MELSTVAALRSQWSKRQQRGAKTRHAHVPGKSPTVVLPALARSPSFTRAVSVNRSNGSNALQTLLAERLPTTDREGYSRNQLRAVAKGKLPCTRNNSAGRGLQDLSTRIKAPCVRREITRQKTVAPLENTGTERRGTLPENVQAAIDHVLTKRTLGKAELSDDHDAGTRSNNEAENCASVSARSGRTGHKDHKGRAQSRRPGAPGLNHLLEFSQSMRGTTLARYRRLVGAVARANLAKSYAAATIRVATHRFEQRCACVLQRAVRQLVMRRRDEAETRAKKLAVVQMQGWWRMRLAVREVKTRRGIKVQEARDAQIALLMQLGAARAIQRVYTCHRHAVYCRNEDLRRQSEVEALRKACSHLVRRYQAQRCQRVEGSPMQSPRGSANESIATKREVVDLETNGLDKQGEVEDPEARVALCESCEPKTPLSAIDSVATDASNDVELEVSRLHAEVGSDEELSPRAHDQVSVPPPTKKFVVQAPSATMSLHSRSKVDKEVMPSSMGDESHDHKLEAFCETPPATNTTTSTTVEAPDPTPAPSKISLKGSDEVPSAVSGAEPSQILAQAPLHEGYAHVEAFSAAARVITHFLRRYVTALQTKKTNAAVQIQRHARSYLAKGCVDNRRLAVLASLREQLQVNWHLPRPDETVSSTRECGDHEDGRDDPPARTTELPETYDLFLPTLQGKLPPGVSLPKCTAGAALIPLWKWNWPDERWVPMDQ